MTLAFYEINFFGVKTAKIKKISEKFVTVVSIKGRGNGTKAFQNAKCQIFAKFIFWCKNGPNKKKSLREFVKL